MIIRDGTTSFQQDLNGDGDIGIAATVIESHGVTSLTRIGGNFYLYDSGSSGPLLKYGGSAVMAGAAGTWLPFAAEATADGYEVAWSLAGADKYSVWKTDTNGNFVSYLTSGAVSGSSAALQSLETSFMQDLNGDGSIGFNLTATIIESNGSTSLTQLGSHYYLYDSTSTGPSLKYSGSEVVAGPAGTWLPFAVEATADGYEVAWRLAGADQYSVWNTDANGNFTSYITSGAVSGSSDVLQSLETSFQQDLNGNGNIGIAATVIESYGVTSLTRIGTSFYLYDSGSSGPVLKYGGSVVVAGTAGTWLPFAAEATADGYKVAWSLAGADKYSVWNTDANGNFTSYITSGAVSGSSDVLQSLETSFQQDLNGDGNIGVAATVVESDGSTSLTQIGKNFYLYDSGDTGPVLKYGGSAVVAGPAGTWLPIGVEATAGGYEVAWSLAGADQYSVWNTDTDGNFTSYITSGAVSGSSNVLQSLETSFQQDLNGDGTTGPAASVIAAAALNDSSGNVVEGDAGENIIVGTSGDDSLTGNGGRDTFVFAANFGNDTVTDFTLGVDIIQFDHTIFADADSVISHTSDDGLGNAIIAADDHGTITVQNVTTATLMQYVSDFHIV